MIKRVLFTAPRRRPLPALFFFGTLAALSVAMDVFGVIPNLQQFSHGMPLVKADNLDVKLLGDVFLVFLFLAIVLAMIRNNTVDQTMEISLLISGFGLLVMFVVFSTPLLVLWGRLHGYHLDHYETARHGGWYVFKLNGT